MVPIKNIVKYFSTAAAIGFSTEGVQKLTNHSNQQSTKAVSAQRVNQPSAAVNIWNAIL